MSLDRLLRSWVLAFASAVACVGCGGEAEEQEVLDVQAEGVDVKVKKSDKGVEVKVEDKDDSKQTQ